MDNVEFLGGWQDKRKQVNVILFLSILAKQLTYNVVFSHTFVSILIAFIRCALHKKLRKILTNVNKCH